MSDRRPSMQPPRLYCISIAVHPMLTKMRTNLQRGKRCMGWYCSAMSHQNICSRHLSRNVLQCLETPECGEVLSPTSCASTTYAYTAQCHSQFIPAPRILWALTKSLDAMITILELSQTHSQFVYFLTVMASTRMWEVIPDPNMILLTAITVTCLGFLWNYLMSSAYNE